MTKKQAIKKITEVEAPSAGVELTRDQMTPEQLQQAKIGNFAAMMNQKILEARKDIETFIEKLGKHPGHAMEWSHGAFQAAARLEIWDQARRAVTTDDGTPILFRQKGELLGGTSFNTLENLIDFTQREVANRALHPKRSTSPTANLMDKERLSAWAGVLEMVKWS